MFHINNILVYDNKGKATLNPNCAKQTRTHAKSEYFNIFFHMNLPLILVLWNKKGSAEFSAKPLYLIL